MRDGNLVNLGAGNEWRERIYRRHEPPHEFDEKSEVVGQPCGDNETGMFVAHALSVHQKQKQSKKQRP